MKFILLVYMLPIISLVLKIQTLKILKVLDKHKTIW